MKLYSIPLSPFASRVRMSIYRKGLGVEIARPPEGGTKGEEFLALNPIGQVPTLLLGSGFAIPESAVIVEYLEDAFPTPSLRPADPEQLARARLFLRMPDLYFQNAPRFLIGMRGNRTEEAVKPHLDNLMKGLSYIDHYVGHGPYAVGGQASIADCALVPVLNIVRLVGRIYESDWIGHFHNLAAYWRAAQTEEINARIIAEQVGGMPPGLREAVGDLPV